MARTAPVTEARDPLGYSGDKGGLSSRALDLGRTRLAVTPEHRQDLREFIWFHQYVARFGPFAGPHHSP